MPLMGDVIGILLAGGQGERLWPLTRDRAKPRRPTAQPRELQRLRRGGAIKTNQRSVGPYACNASISPRFRRQSVCSLAANNP